MDNICKTVSKFNIKPSPATYLSSTCKKKCVIKIFIRVNIFIHTESQDKTIVQHLRYYQYSFVLIFYHQYFYIKISNSVELIK